jgi:hypothetical protein
MQSSTQRSFIAEALLKRTGARGSSVQAGRPQASCSAPRRAAPGIPRAQQTAGGGSGTGGPPVNRISGYRGGDGDSDASSGAPVPGAINCALHLSAERPHLAL